MGKRCDNAGHTVRYGRMKAAGKVTDAAMKVANTVASPLTHKAAMAAYEAEKRAAEAWESKLDPDRR